ncbi:MAG TPA: c-type cytochrome [Egibacteraceae bacterium]|nr:c-type cytochrome [Egibacteraceae bacterium]
MSGRAGAGTRRLRPLLSWALLAVAGTALTAGAPGAQAQQDAIDPATAIQGADVYTSQCARCHGAAGQGGQTPSGPDAPALRGAHIALVDLVLRTGRMPPGDPDGDTKARRPLTDERRDALLAWMDDQLGLRGEIPRVPVGGNPARGQEVYAANCAQCHGSTGGGGVAGGGAFTPVLVDREPLVIAEAIRMGPFQMPQFGEDVISDRELADTIAFLEEVQGEPGTPVGLVELNPVFAGAFVFAISLAAIVSAMWLSGRVSMFPDAPEDGEQP